MYFRTATGEHTKTERLPKFLGGTYPARRAHTVLNGLKALAAHRAKTTGCWCTTRAALRAPVR